MKGLENLIEEYLQGLKQTNKTEKNLDRSSLSNPSLSMSKINMNTQSTAVKLKRKKIIFLL